MEESILEKHWCFRKYAAYKIRRSEDINADKNIEQQAEVPGSKEGQYQQSHQAEGSGQLPNSQKKTGADQFFDGKICLCQQGIDVERASKKEEKYTLDHPQKECAEHGMTCIKKYDSYSSKLQEEQKKSGKMDQPDYSGFFKMLPKIAPIAGPYSSFTVAELLKCEMVKSGGGCTNGYNWQTGEQP